VATFEHRRLFARRHALFNVADTILSIVFWPFRAITSAWNFGFRIGIGFFDFLYKAVFAVIGLGLIGFFIFGVGSVLLHPLIHHR
jgi:hypothetical protein